DHRIFAAVVERDVLLGLEKTQFADTLGGDAAGGEVGDTSGFEFDANVGNVYFAGQDREADGANLFDRRVHEGQHDVEVVNHQVEDDVDVERARREHAEPVNFEKHGAGDDRKRGANCGIEALEMSDLHDAAGALREF